MIRWAADHVEWTHGGRRMHACFKKLPDVGGEGMTKKTGKLLELWPAGGWKKE